LDYQYKDLFFKTEKLESELKSKVSDLKQLTNALKMLEEKDSKNHIVIQDLQSQNLNMNDYTKQLLNDMSQLNRIYNESESMNTEHALQIDKLNHTLDTLTQEYNQKTEQYKTEIEELIIDKESFRKDVTILREDIL